MLIWVFAWIVLAIAAAVFGFSILAGAAAWLAKILFFLFCALAIVAFAVRLRRPDR
jgi:uncharacterized membrane protein YtjA (UPF0391 family)